MPLRIVEAQPIDLDLDYVSVVCPGVDDARITINPTGGFTSVSGDYTIRWYRGIDLLGETGRTLNNIGAGLYTVEVIDDRNCLVSEIVEIDAVPSFTVNLVPTPITCTGEDDGAMEIELLGGSAPFTIQWFRDGSLIATGVTKVEDLRPENYTVTVRDVNGCQIVQEAFVVSNPTTTFEITGDITNVRCFGEENGAIDITMVVDAGHPLEHTYTYTWLKNDFPYAQGVRDLANLGSGTYTLVVNDNSLGATGCEKSRSFTVDHFSQIIVNVVDFTPQLCPGESDGEILIEVLGGAGNYTYQWFQGNNPLAETTNHLTGQVPGFYTVVVTDGQGCSAAPVDRTIEAIPSFVINETITNATCIGTNNGQIALQIVGGVSPFTFEWVNVANPGDIISYERDVAGLAPGEYTVTVRDNNDCNPVQESFMVTEPSTSFTIAETIQHVQCNGGTDGAIQINIVGDPGHPSLPSDYLFSWTKVGDAAFSSNTQNIASLSAGVYVVTVNDHGCTKQASFTVNQALNPIVINESINPMSCAGADDASASILINGGFIQAGNDYVITWFKNNVEIPGETQPTIEGLDPGNYSVRVVDDRLCTATRQFTIQDLPLFTHAPQITQITCPGADNGAIALTLSTTQVDVTWLRNGSFFSTSRDISALSPGTYSYSITSANSCINISGQDVVINPPASFAISEVVTPVTCFNDTNSAIDVTITLSAGHPRGLNNFIYSWTKDGQPFSNVLDILNLTAGTYELTVNDNGCTQNKTFVLDNPTEIVLNMQETQMSCATSNDGSVKIQPTGGIALGNYLVRWFKDNVALTDANNLLEITGLSPGSYRVLVTDDRGCFEDDIRNILPQPALVVADPVVTKISCRGETDASISVAVSGGTGNYTFVWTKDGFHYSNSQNLTGLSAGNYEVTVTDGVNCSNVPKQAVVPVATGFDIVGAATNVFCNSDTDGSISVTINADEGHAHPDTYTYTWFRTSGGLTELPEHAGKRVITSLPEGDYRLVVFDNTTPGCTARAEFSIVAAREILLNPVVNQITCPGANDGRIELDISGGETTGGYTIRWFKDTDLMAAQSTRIIANLAPGLYKAEVSDSEGCMKRYEANLPDKTPIKVDTTLYQIRCLGENNGAIRVNISGGEGSYARYWRKAGAVIAQNTDSIGNLAPGKYELIVEDQSSCPRFQRTYQIDTLKTQYTVNIGLVSPIVCPNETNGVLRANVSFSPGHPTAGIHRRWFKDNAETPFSTDTLVKNLGAGVYRLEVTDTLGCVKTSSITLIYSTTLEIRANKRDLVCNDATNAVIQIDPRGGWGGYTVVWSEASIGVINNNTFRLTNIGAGDYTVSLIDSVGCRKDTLIRVPNPARMAISRTINNVNCKGGNNGAISINVANGTSPYTFEWRRDTALFATTQNITELLAGNYRVRVRDSNGCILLSDQYTVTEPTVEWTVDAVVELITCHNDTDGAISPTISLTGGEATFRFNWMKDNVVFAQSTRNIAGLSPGLYQLEVIDNFGCVKNSEYEIANPSPMVMTEGISNITCFGARDGRIAIRVTGGYGDYTYRWRRFNSAMPDTIPTVENLDVGVYQVEVTDAEGCMISRRFEISQAFPLIVSHTVIHNTCPTNFDSEIRITVTGGIAPYRFLWANSNGVPISTQKDIFNLPPDEYTLVVVDSFFCEVSTQPIRVTAPPALGFTFREFKDNLCPQTSNGMISVQGKGGFGPYTFSFDSAVFSSKNDFFGLARGTYALAMMDSRGCLFDTTVFIDNQYELEADFTYDFQNLAIDYPIEFKDQSLGQNIVKWFWTFGDQRAANTPTSTITYEAVGQYVVELTVENEVQCVSTKRDTLEIEKGFVFTIPGGFSPNADGLNDFFRPVFDNVTDITTRILDRNGQLVFASDERSEFWDGNIDGRRAPQGAYYYEISYTSRAGKRRFEKGKVLLIR